MHLYALRERSMGPLEVPYVMKHFEMGATFIVSQNVSICSNRREHGTAIQKQINYKVYNVGQCSGLENN
jgi:hypothetical protein